MERYAHQENIRRFEHQLRREADPGKRAVLEQLLTEERRQLERCLQESANPA